MARSDGLFWGDLADNLRAGFRLLTLRHIDANDLTPGVGQYVALQIVCVFAEIVMAYATADAPRVFNMAGLYSTIVIQQLVVAAIAGIWLLFGSFDLARMIIALSSSTVFMGLVIALFFWAQAAVRFYELDEDFEIATASMYVAIILMAIAAFFVSHWRAVQALAPEPRRGLAVALVLAQFLAAIALPSQPSVIGPSTELSDSYSIYGQLRDALKSTPAPEPEKPAGDTI